MACLDAPSRLGLHPAVRQPHGVRLRPWRLVLSSSSSRRIYTLLSRQFTICNVHSHADDLLVAEDGLVEVVENIPDPFSMERAAISSPTSSNKQKAALDFILELGMDHEEMDNLVREFPAFAYYDVEQNIKPLVKLLIELGLPRSSILGIIKRRPQLFEISMSRNVKAMMVYLENIGVNKAQWSKVICRFPAFLMYSRNKVETTVSFLIELGVPKENIGRVLARCPALVCYNVDENLRPTAEYFRSIGADVAAIIHRTPQAFGLNVETKLKPITEFFLERGFSTEEVGIMVTRFGTIHTLRLEENLLPKYEFFLTMEYSRGDLVKFPQYFGYGLEQRIKPRYAQMTNCGVRLNLGKLLAVSNDKFEEILKRSLSSLRRQKFRTSTNAQFWTSFENNHHHSHTNRA